MAAAVGKQEIKKPLQGGLQSSGGIARIHIDEKNTASDKYQNKREINRSLSRDEQQSSVIYL